MFTHVLCLLFGVSLCQAAAAQSIPAPTAVPSMQTVPAANSLTRADTARAIHALFRNRRGGGTGWLGLATASILASTLPAQQSTSAGVWTPGVVAGSAFMLIGLNKRIQFRPGRERNVLRELAATGHLPLNVARRLRGNFTPVHGTDSDYNPLLAKGIYSSTSASASNDAQLLAAAHTDTLRAIGNLFERRRKGGKKWAYVGVGSILSMARALTSTASNGDRISGGNLAFLAGIVVGVPTAISIGNLAAYSEKREEEVDRAFRSGQSLPKKIRQRLKKKDFE